MVSARKTVATARSSLPHSIELQGRGQTGAHRKGWERRTLKDPRVAAAELLGLLGSKAGRGGGGGSVQREGPLSQN